MYARALDDASTRLRELRHQEWEAFVLAALALGGAVTATRVAPQLSLPLLVGGLVIGAVGVRTLWRRWDLVDRLAGERDAYAISEVFAYAAREATMERRRTFAALIRAYARDQDDAVAAELEALEDELEDESLDLDPACAVACLRLVTDPTDSALLNSALPRETLRFRVLRIRSGFAPRGLAA